MKQRYNIKTRFFHLFDERINFIDELNIFLFYLIMNHIT